MLHIRVLLHLHMTIFTLRNSKVGRAQQVQNQYQSVVRVEPQTVTGQCSQVASISAWLAGALPRQETYLVSSSNQLYCTGSCQQYISAQSCSMWPYHIMAGTHLLCWWEQVTQW